MSWFTSVLSPRDAEIMARERELDKAERPMRTPEQVQEAIKRHRAREKEAP